jgi:hypothetical protein
MNHIVGSPGLLDSRRRLRIQDVKPDVTLNDFRHQGIDRPAASRNIVKNLRAFRFLIQCSVDRFHLTFNASYAIQKLLLLSDCVCHKKRKNSLQAYAGRYTLVVGADNQSATLREKEAHPMPDGSNSQRRHEDMCDAESAEPPSLYGHSRL